MTRPALWTSSLLLLLAAALFGCRPMSSARYAGPQYTGPASPLTSNPALAQTQSDGGPLVVRGQNGYDRQGLWQNYQQQSQPQENLWPANTATTPQATPSQPQDRTQGQAGRAPGQQMPAAIRQPAQGQFVQGQFVQGQRTPGAPAGAQPRQPGAPQTAPQTAPPGNAPEGYVGGGIPVHGNGQPMNFAPDSAIGSQNPQFGQPLPPPGAVLGPNPATLPEADVDVFVEETETGRFMFGVGVNSDAGVTGQIVIDERNFDLWRPPRSFGDILDGTAFRGAGQGLRIEAVPGDLVQRYVVNFTEPYLFDTNVSLNVSGFFYDRRFEDWDEQRMGGRIGLGYRLTPDLSVATSLSAEEVDIHDPRLGPGPAFPQLTAALGEHDLYSGGVSLTYDTRDIPFNPTEGQMFELSFDQTFGSFDYPKVEADYRRYFLVAERPDGSGRHVLAFQFRAGVTGSQTPIFENFYAGGFSTMRGFDFRGASPVEGGAGGVKVGGEFMFLGTVEYRFPLTADDMLHGVAFVDYGTVEEDVAIRSENYRVAPGLGLRIAIPAMGPAPIALDFAFPVASAATDEEEVFSFFVGFGR